jgi:hypothetical protein
MDRIAEILASVQWPSLSLMDIKTSITAQVVGMFILK